MPFPSCQPIPGVKLILVDALQWMETCNDHSIHAIVTDPPYGLLEFEEKHHEKLHNGRGGIWRIPPALNGSPRNPVPRFTVLTVADRERLQDFFTTLAAQSARILVPGGHLAIASNPLVSSITFTAIESAGLEKRGELIRLVTTLRGGDRPKGGEQEFSNVSVMPRSGWEPWGLFRKPLAEKTVADNLRVWGTGGFRRIGDNDPFWDVFECGPARPNERQLAPHPTLKPQKLMRYIVRGILPLERGLIYDPFAGSGSTLAAAAHWKYSVIGTERDRRYYDMACQAIPKLAKFSP